MGSRIVYRDEPDSSLGDVMQFRLFYEGLFKSAQRDPRPGQSDRLADHKHEIRRHFHRQLRHFWEINGFLSQYETEGTLLGVERHEKRPLKDALAAWTPSLGGFHFVPLVCERFNLSCQIDLLVMRRDRPGGIWAPRDLDNRLKVIFDALKVPRNLSELGAAVPLDGENPLFVLLEDDSLITHVSVETDELLDPPDSAGKDDAYARVFLKVSIKPTVPDIFNIGFS